MKNFLDRPAKNTIPITPFRRKEDLSNWLKKQDNFISSWIHSHKFSFKAGAFLVIPGKGGGIARVLLAIPEGSDLMRGQTSTFAFAPLVKALAGLEPESYEIGSPLGKDEATKAALGWGLACYHFGRYTKNKSFPKLVWPKNADRKKVLSTVAATFMIRDLINTPASDLGPADLLNAVKKLGHSHKATVKVIQGHELVKKNYPAIFAVGKGSDRAPGLADLTWGNPGHPKLTLVGKGVVYDTGGYDLKPSSAMRNMKKDMGGGAHVMGLAQMIMDAKLPVRLRVLIPAVENSVSGKAFRPGDVIATRKGLSVEIDNTDAEGRLILCDALTEACREKPDLLIDFATLTGAARVAVGLEMAAMFTNDDKIAQALAQASVEEEDPLWRQPLYEVYADDLDSSLADLANSGNNRAGAITAALFLKKFVDDGIKWVHFDINAENPQSRPGRPKGGEAQGLRATFALIEKRYGKKK